MNRNSKWPAALKAAFPHALPIITGFLFLGTAYGVYMNVSGFSFMYPLLISITVFGGSLQFVLTAMLLAPFAPLSVFLLAVMIQARHLFYGLAMLEKFNTAGAKKWPLIFLMCDESFSVNCSADVPEGIDQPAFWLCVSLYIYLSWVIGSLFGGLLGSLITFNTEGLDFVMTAMFAVIFLNQWLKDKKHGPAVIGAASSLLCLKLFGPDSFIIPSMLLILLFLTVFRKSIEEGLES